MLNFKNKKVLVMGLGLHGGGVSLSRWLVKKGAKVMITDLKTKKELKKSLDKLKNLPIKFILGEHRKQDFQDQDLIIQNPGVPRESEFLKIAQKNNIPIFNEASVFFDLVKSDKIIAITGTRGKSTTTMLIYRILKEKDKDIVFGGNIRIKTMFDIIDKVKSKVVLELSSWHLEGLEKIRKSPHIAIVTNIMPDHLNRYKDLNDYISAKKNIYLFQKKNDFSIFNKDNEHTRQMGKETPSKRFWVSLKYFPDENGSYLKNNKIFFRFNGKEQKVLDLKDIKIPGEHNIYNVLNAITVAMILKTGVLKIRKAVKNFKGLPDRIEFVKEKKGVKYYNDTTATTPDATIVALKTLGKDRNIVLIAGGSDKNLNFGDLSEEIKKYVKFVFLFPGKASDKLKKELLKKEISFQTVKNMQESLKKVQKKVQRGDIVLLSPASASFGLFENEFARGEEFKKNI